MIKDSKFSLVQRHDVPLNTEIAEKPSKQMNGIWKGSRKPHAKGETYKEERGFWKKLKHHWIQDPLVGERYFLCYGRGCEEKPMPMWMSWGFGSKETSWFLHSDFRLITKLIGYWNSVDKAFAVLCLILLNWNTKIRGFDLHNLLWLKILICS